MIPTRRRIDKDPALIGQEGGNELYTSLIIVTISWSDGSPPPAAM
jgi:hypothetical protein